MTPPFCKGSQFKVSSTDQVLAQFKSRARTLIKLTRYVLGSVTNIPGWSYSDQSTLNVNPKTADRVSVKQVFGLWRLIKLEDPFHPQFHSLMPLTIRITIIERKAIWSCRVLHKNRNYNVPHDISFKTNITQIITVLKSYRTSVNKLFMMPCFK